MNQSTRLLLNTAVSYAKMIITVPISLIVTRWVLDALEEVDFGLWSALSASGAFLAILTSALVSSGQRHLAFAIGQGDELALRKKFKAVLALFWIVGPAVGVVGAMVAPLILRGVNAPADRATAAAWVLAITITNLALQAMATPYRALLTAYQQLVPLAVIEIANRLVNLGLIGLLFVLPGDKLIAYAWIFFFVSVGTTMVIVGLCVNRHPAARVTPPGVTRADLKEVVSFAWWTAIGKLAEMFRNRGALLLVTSLFGAIAGTAFALAIQAHYALYRVAQGLSTAVTPAITNQAGRQSGAAVAKLGTAANKYSMLITSFFWAPLMFDCETLLSIWLTKPTPAGTALFTRLFCTMAFVGTASWGFSMVLQAKNKIRAVSLGAVLSTGVALLAAWVGCRWFDWPMWSVPAIMIAATLFMSLGVRPTLAARAIDQSPLKMVLEGPFLAMVGIGAGLAAAATVAAVLQPGFVRLVVVGIVYALVSLGVSWFYVLLPDEKSLVTRGIDRVFSRLTTP